MAKLSRSPASAAISCIFGEDVAVARRDDQRLARAAQHRVHLHEVVDRLRRVLGQAHAHDEVDVGQLLAQRRHALDVGAADAAALARVRVADVEHVRAGAAVRVGGVEHERLGLAAARLDRPVARRALERRFDQLGGDAHARAVDLRAGAGEDLDGRRVLHVDARLGEHLERRLVHAPAGVLVPDPQASSVHGRLPSLAVTLADGVRAQCRGACRLCPTPARSRRCPALDRAPTDGDATPMDVQHVYDDGLCMQCGTCAGVCPADARPLDWDLGPVPPASSTATRAPTAASASRRARARARLPPGRLVARAQRGRGRRDFLGPWRGLWFGWAADPAVAPRRRVRRRGHRPPAGALETARADAALAVGMGAREPAAGRRRRLPHARGGRRMPRLQVQRRRRQRAARTVLDEPGRYVLVGLPCHIQGLRLAQRRSRRLRERVVLTSASSAAHQRAARNARWPPLQAGVDPGGRSARVSYRGPDWPGGMRLAAPRRRVRRRDYPGLLRPLRRGLHAVSLPALPGRPGRARGHLGGRRVARAVRGLGRGERRDRQHAGRRAPAGGPRRPARADATATPDEMVASQAETCRVKRDILRGRLWLRSLAPGGRSRVPRPGSDALRPRDRRLRRRRRGAGAPVPVPRRPALPGVPLTRR